MKWPEDDWPQVQYEICPVGLDSYEASRLKRNSDNSVYIYLGERALQGCEDNWLPLAGEDFFVIFRFYGPRNPSTARLGSSLT
jgi:hypothetical protein